MKTPFSEYHNFWFMTNVLPKNKKDQIALFFLQWKVNKVKHSIHMRNIKKYRNILEVKS